VNMMFPTPVMKPPQPYHHGNPIHSPQLIHRSHTEDQKLLVLLLLMLVEVES